MLSNRAFCMQKPTEPKAIYEQEQRVSRIEVLHFQNDNGLMNCPPCYYCF